MPTAIPDLNPNSLKSQNILNSGAYNIEGGQFSDLKLDSAPDPIFDAKTWTKIKKYDPGWAIIWAGKLHGHPVDVWPQISLDLNLDSQIQRFYYSGRLSYSPTDPAKLIYTPKRFNRDSWTSYLAGDILLYGPPKVIRQQGRLAKENANSMNNHPAIAVTNRRGKLILFIDQCFCGGELVRDQNEYLCCADCGMIYNDYEICQPQIE